MQNLLIFHQGCLILKKEYKAVSLFHLSAGQRPGLMRSINSLKAESLEEVTLQIERHIYLIYSEVYERKLCGKKNPDHFKKCMLQAFSLLLDFRAF